jgi:hypothetical protein
MKQLILLLSLIFFISAQDADKPTPQEILKVQQYLEEGRDGAILYESAITSNLKADRSLGYERNVPVNELTEIKVDSTVYVWMKFLLPFNHVDKSFTINISRGPIPRLVDTPELRTKNNIGTTDAIITRKFTPRRPGDYSVKIFKNEILVTEHTFTVVE